jgi:hypothetical protein
MLFTERGCGLGFESHLLCLQLLPLLLNLMDGPASLADLLHQVLDLVAQGSILPSHVVQLRGRLVVSSTVTISLRKN